MNSKILTFCILFQCCFLITYAQNGPGGVGDTTGTSNLQLWLSASDLSATHSDEDPVLLWKDKSGAGNDVLSTISIAPIYRNAVIGAYPGVEFQGYQYLQTNGMSSSFNNPEATIFLVKTGPFSGASIAVASSGWSNEMLLLENEQYHHSSSGNFTRLPHSCLGDIPQDEFSIICGIYGQDDDDLRYYANGLQSNSNIITAGFPTDFAAVDRLVTIGQRDQLFEEEYLVGTIVEVIIYNTQLSDIERQSVEEYLRCTYEVTPTLCSALSDEACTTSSNASLANKINVSLTPNPASDYISLEINGELPISDTEYMIYDQLGRLLQMDNVIAGKAMINVSHFSSGIYYLELKSGKSMFTKKIVVN